MRTGTPTQIRRIMPGIRQSLVAAVMGPQYGQPSHRSEPRTFNGKHEAKPGSAANDRLILEIRRLYEQGGKTPSSIHQHITDLGHHKTRSWVIQTCNYHNRSHLVPAANADSYLQKAS